MKGKITYSLKPPLMKRPSEVGYWKLNEMLESSECLRRSQFLNFWGKTIWGNYAKRVEPKWERRAWNQWNHIRERGFIVNGWESSLDFDKQLCYCTCLREMFEDN